MNKSTLLPGVIETDVPRPVQCDARAAIIAARRRAVVRDVLHVALLAAVDFLFVYWPESRFPFLDRGQSMAFLYATNLALGVQLWLSRVLPRWSARRIAGTWCRGEQMRFSRVASARPRTR